METFIIVDSEDSNLFLLRELFIIFTFDLLFYKTVSALWNCPNLLPSTLPKTLS